MKKQIDVSQSDHTPLDDQIQKILNGTFPLPQKTQMLQVLPSRARQTKSSKLKSVRYFSEDLLEQAWRQQFFSVFLFLIQHMLHKFLRQEIYLHTLRNRWDLQEISRALPNQCKKLEQKLKVSLSMEIRSLFQKFTVMKLRSILA